MVAILLFLFSNIKSTESGVGYLFMYTAVGCAALIIVSRLIFDAPILVTKSSFYLLAFLAFFLLRLLLDVSDPFEIKARTIGTSGGLIFALLFGVVCSVTISTIIEHDRKYQLQELITAALLLLCLILAVDSLLQHSQAIRLDRFLVDAENRKYQRSGNFIVMLTTVMSILVAWMRVRPVKTSLLQRSLSVVYIGAYLVTIPVLLLISQLIGSNTGFVVTLMLLIGTLVWVCRPRAVQREFAVKISRGPLGIMSTIRHELSRFLGTGVLISILILVVGVSVLYYMNLEPSDFRIYGFSDQRIGGNSLISRLNLLTNNFWTQFAYSPFFGKLDVEVITTGRNTYAHSLVSLLPELGIVGTMLFGLYLRAIFVDLSNMRNGGNLLYHNVDFGIFRIILFLIVVAFALIGTFFTWIPLWFSFGVLFPPIVLKKRTTLVSAFRHATIRNGSVGTASD